MQVVLRTFHQSDFQDLLKIYKAGIKTGIATFETELPTWKVWNRKYIEHPRIVATIDKSVVGYAVLSKTSKRQVYRGVAEVSVYVSKDVQGQKIGKQLLQKLIDQSEKEAFWTLQANIFPQNKASIALHKNCGFIEVGVREKIGQLHGQWFDNVLLERRSTINSI
jgi:phosphinothricin acetyltransferase